MLELFKTRKPQIIIIRNFSIYVCINQILRETMLRSHSKESKANIATKINPTGYSGRGLVKQFTAPPVSQNVFVTPSNKPL